MKDLIAQIELRFTILLTIGVFFPVLMSAYYLVAGGNKQDQQNVFVFYSLVGLYIGAFIIFELTKLLPHIKLGLQVLDWTLLIGIACFALPIMFTIVAYQSITIPNHFSYLVDIGFLILSYAGLTIVPYFLIWFTIVLLFASLATKFIPALAHKEIF
jgi:hypothetical protein